MYRQHKSKFILSSVVVAGLGLALSGSFAWGKSSSNLAPEAQGVKVLVSKGKGAPSMSIARKVGSCVPYVINNKAGVIYSDHKGEMLSKIDSVFEEGKLLVAVSKPNFKISLQPDGIKSGIFAVVEFPANSVARVEQLPNGQFRVANLLGDALPVKIRTKGQHETVSVLAGEELSLAPEYVKENFLIPADGVDREAINCGAYIAGCKASKYKFDAAQMVKNEKLFACDDTFAPGSGLLRFAKRELLARERSEKFSPIANAK